MTLQPRTIDPDYNCLYWLETDQGPAPIPMPCACGEPARYGRARVWYCSECWQTSGIWRTQ